MSRARRSLSAPLMRNSRFYSLRSLAIAAALLSCSGDRVLGPSLEPTPASFTHVAMPGVRISEFHYDNDGLDEGERIEISGPAGRDLTGWSIVRYNGATPSAAVTYATPAQSTAITGAIPATCDVRGVFVVAYPRDGLQNGPSDGFALVAPGGVVVELLSYEGSFVAANGPAAGMTAVDVGVSQGSTTPVNSSIQRQPNGHWVSTPGSNTFGACNDYDPNQPGPAVRVEVAPASASIEVETTQQFSATAYDETDRVTSATITWSSSDPSIASINPSTGVATGLQAGGPVTITASSSSTVRATASLTVTTPPPPPLVRFSELHYDNFGEDANERVEIEGPAGTSLLGWKVVLYNGNGGVAYTTTELTNVIPATESCDGRGVVVLRYPPNGIQNGSPDGLALVDTDGSVVEFLSYEGVFTATDGPAGGMASRDIRAAQSSTPVGQSLQRRADGRWTGPVAHSFGVCNFTGATPPPSEHFISFTGRLPRDPALPVGFEDQLFATLRNGETNAEIPTTFTWTSETPDVATVDADGVVRALGPGTMVIRATSATGITETYALASRVAVASTTASYVGNTEFGIPADGTFSDDHIVTRAQYTASWNPNKGIPNWVSFNLEATHFGAEDRCDCFTFDPATPGPSYTTADYTGAGAFHGYGIDRGHLVRSFDRTSASLDNARTYYFSNIIPQAADNNQGPWAAFEAHLGDLARFSNREIYVIVGAAGSKGTVKNEGRITIPAHTWKVAVIMSRNEGLSDVDSYDDFEILAVIMPNDPGIRNVSWQTYKTTVNAVETLSGYNVLSLLSDEIEAAVESGVSSVMAALDALVSGGALNRGNANSLRVKLDAAAAAFERGSATAAVNQLEAFLHEVDAMVHSRRLSEAAAASLRSTATALIQSVSN